MNIKTLGTIILAIASIGGLSSSGILNSVQAQLLDISEIECLAGCIDIICPADFDSFTTTTGETGVDNSNNSGIMTGNTPSASLSQSSSTSQTQECNPTINH